MSRKRQIVWWLVLVSLCGLMAAIGGRKEKQVRCRNVLISVQGKFLSVFQKCHVVHEFSVVLTRRKRKSVFYKSNYDRKNGVKWPCLGNRDIVRAYHHFIIVKNSFSLWEQRKSICWDLWSS